MRSRMAFALFASVCLIGLASWSRFADARNAPAPQIVQMPSADTSEEEIQKILETYRAASTTQKSAVPLTDTDLVARQLTTDYMKLINSGQATSDNIEALAGFYTDNITSLVTPPQVKLTDIKVTTDTTTNLQSYGDSIARIYFKYEDQLKKEYTGDPTVDFSTFDARSEALAKKVGIIYKQRADELASIPVPSSLVEIHLKLINNYLATASYFSLIADTEKDPVKSFAALASLTNTEGEVDQLLMDLVNSFKKYGI